MPSLPSREENQMRLISKRNNQNYFLKQRLTPMASFHSMHVVVKEETSHTDSFLYNAGKEGGVGGC